MFRCFLTSVVTDNCYPYMSGQSKEAEMKKYSCMLPGHSTAPCPNNQEYSDKYRTSPPYRISTKVNQKTNKDSSGKSTYVPKYWLWDKCLNFENFCNRQKRNSIEILLCIDSCIEERVKCANFQGHVNYWFSEINYHHYAHEYFYTTITV